MAGSWSYVVPELVGVDATMATFPGLVLVVGAGEDASEASARSRPAVSWRELCLRVSVT